MKRVLQILAAAGISLFALTGVVSAQQNCTIENTGEGSVNVCENTTVRSCTVTNNNTITFTDDNSQVAASGSASGSGNTTVYTVSSGNASNNNSSVVSVTVDNSAAAENCVVKTVTRTPVETPEAPEAAAPTAPAPVAKLPKTSGSSPLVFVGLGLAAAAGLAAISRAAIALQSARNR